jgi:ankyrin repeat protein
MESEQSSKVTDTTTDEIIDLLLDQEGFECDPINRREGDTPLHSAVRWVNEQSTENQEYGYSLIEMMLEAGSDPKLVIPHRPSKHKRCGSS